MEKQIGHYQIVSELGRGGMGVVYKAHEQSLNRFVAIKTLGTHLSEDPSYVERFVREAQSAAGLNHPNIVQIFAISEEDGQHYFVMEYVPGTSVLAMVRNQGKMDTVQAFRIILQTAAGLQVAHEQGIVHRDIKPANLMVNERGLVKIADFGLALALGGASRLTATGTFMGTPGYLSPEQCLDEDIDNRTDIYSLGVSLFEMLTGSIPFKADSPLALLRQIIEVEPPDVREVNADIDSETRNILVKMMAKKRDDRYSDCAEIINDIQKYLDEHGVAASTAAGTSPGHLVAPPAPPVVEDVKTLDGSPTMAVPSGEGDAPTPPPTPTPLETEPVGPPVPEAIVVDEMPEKKSKTGLVVALVLAACLVVFVGAGAVAWKTGLVQRGLALVKGESDVASQTQRASSDPALMVSAEAMGNEAEGEPMSSDAPDGGYTANTNDLGDTEVEAVEKAAPERGLGVEAGKGSSEAARDSYQPGSTSNSADNGREPGKQLSASDNGTRVEPEPQKRAVPVPVEVSQATGVVVIAMGENLLGGAAEAFVEKTLAEKGIQVVDERGIIDISGLVGRQDANLGEVVDAMSPYAHFLVFLRAEYLGDRQLNVLGRYDVEYQARLHTHYFDLRSRTPAKPGHSEQLGYTSLNVERNVEKYLRPQLRGIAANFAE